MPSNAPGRDRDAVGERPGAVRTEALGNACLAIPDGPGPHPGLVVVHEAAGLNDNIRDIC